MKTERQKKTAAKKAALTFLRRLIFLGSKLYLGVEFRTFLIFDIKIGIGVTLSYN